MKGLMAGLGLGLAFALIVSGEWLIFGIPMNVAVGTGMLIVGVGGVLGYAMGKKK